jgi:bifunctional DNA-binding transcriptional regulator/antitoxin component of YhaV-PrlF toxin-antitoxin module
MSIEAMVPVEFVTTTQMDEKGQVAIPKRYRDALKLETGARMAVPLCANIP